MDIEAISALLDMLIQSPVDAFSYEQKDFQLRVKMDRTMPVRAAASNEPVPTPVLAADVAVTRSVDTIRSHAIGTLEMTHPTQDYRGVRAGDTVAAGDIVCLIRSGAFYAAVRAPRAGRLGRPLQSPGAVIGFGDALFEFE